MASISGYVLTATIPGRVTWPVPRSRVTPASVSRLAAVLSSRLLVTSSRRATAFSQASPRPAASSSVLEGRQARYGDSPPTRPASTSATDRPPEATSAATCTPAVPPPSTTTSNSGIWLTFPSPRPEPRPRLRRCFPSSQAGPLLRLGSQGSDVVAGDSPALGWFRPRLQPF